MRATSIRSLAVAGGLLTALDSSSAKCPFLHNQVNDLQGDHRRLSTRNLSESSYSVKVLSRLSKLEFDRSLVIIHPPLETHARCMRTPLSVLERLRVATQRAPVIPVLASAMTVRSMQNRTTLVWAWKAKSRRCFVCSG